MKLRLVEGNFYENEIVTLEIDGKQIKRKVKFDNFWKDLYVTYKNCKYYLMYNIETNY